MEISHFLSLVDSLCVVNVLYSSYFNDGGFFREHKLPVTVHKKTSTELLAFVFQHDEVVTAKNLALYSDGHYKSICAIFIVLNYVDKGGKFPGKTQRQEVPKNRVSKLRSFIPKRNYFAVFSDRKSFLKMGNEGYILCNDFCRFPDNLAFFIQGNSRSSKITKMCVLYQHILTMSAFRYQSEKPHYNFQLQMAHLRIPNALRSLDDIFMDYIDIWVVAALINIGPDYDFLLQTPAEELENFNLKILLRRLALRDIDKIFNYEFVWDSDPVNWYINLNLLARSNASGTVLRDTRFRIVEEFNLKNTELNNDIVVTRTTELEGITCYREPLLSFHMYSSPFVINLWISLVLGIIFVSAFMNVYIYFYHKDIASSFSSTLLSISLLANVSYYIPKSLWESNVFIFACTPWILTTMILSNCYQSLVISEINAPMEGQRLSNVSKYTICENQTNLLVNPPLEVINAGRKVQDFKQNLGLARYIEPKKISKQFLRNHFNRIHEESSKFQFPNCFSLLSEPSVSGFPNGYTSTPYVYTLFEKAFAGEVVLFEEPRHGDQDIDLLEIFLRLYPFDPNFDSTDGVVLEREAAIEKERIKCEKSV